MKVMLKETWFGPGARRYRKGEQEIADELCVVGEDGKFKYLPSNSAIVKDKGKQPLPKPQLDTLRDLDHARAQSDALTEAQRKAEDNAKQAEDEPVSDDPEEVKRFQQKEADDRAAKAKEFHKQLAEDAKKDQEQPAEGETSAPARRRRSEA